MQVLLLLDYMSMDNEGQNCGFKSLKDFLMGFCVWSWVPSIAVLSIKNDKLLFRFAWRFVCTNCEDLYCN